jgi:hypothetical protein
VPSGLVLPNVYGPAIGPFGTNNKYRLAYTQQIPANRFTQQSTGVPLAEGPTVFSQAFFNTTGVGVGQVNVLYAGNGDALILLGNAPQSQTIGVGNGSTTTCCSAPTFVRGSTAMENWPSTPRR